MVNKVGRGGPTKTQRFMHHGRYPLTLTLTHTHTHEKNIKSTNTAIFQDDEMQLENI